MAWLENLLDSKEGSDYCFIVGPSAIRVKAHKFILLRRSKFLDNNSSENPQAAECQLPETSEKVFNYLMRYLYLDEFEKEIEVGDLMKLIRLAKTFDVSPLVDHCIKQLNVKICIDNCLKIFSEASASGRIDVEVHALAFIYKNASALLMSEKLMQLSRSNLIKLFKSDELACIEIEVFKAALRWTNFNYEKQFIGPPSASELCESFSYFVPFIRFPLMSAQEIAEEVAPADLLSSEQLLSLYNFIYASNERKPIMTFFNTKPRAIHHIVKVKSEPEIYNDKSLMQNGLSPSAPVKVDNESKSPINNERKVSENLPNPFNSFSVTKNENGVSLSTMSKKRRFSETESTSCKQLLNSIVVKDRPIASSSANSTHSVTQIQSEPISTTSKNRNTNGILDLDLSESDEMSPDSTVSTLIVSNEFLSIENGSATPPPDQMQSDPNPSTSASITTGTSSSFDTTKHCQDSNVSNTSDHITGRSRVVSIRESELTSAISTPLIIQIDVPEVREHCLNVNLEILHKETFKRFSNFFDIRRHVSFRKQNRIWNDWKIQNMWDLSLKTPISIKVNGATLLNVNKFKKELTITIGYDSKKILKGLNPTDDIRKLNLVKTIFPTEHLEGFPTQLLEQVLFYNLWAKDEYSLGNFTKKCPNLVSLSSVLIIPELAPVLNMVKLHLTNDLVSEEKLQSLALSKTKISFTLGTVKTGVTELCLDYCCWIPEFATNIHLIFPNLKKVTFSEEPSRMAVRETDKTIFMSAFPLRFFLNILKIKPIEYIRIWGLAWKYFPRFPATTNPKGKWGSSKSHANLQVTEIDVKIAGNFLKGCGLNSRATNFEIKKDSNDKSKWEGKEFDDNESEYLKGGYWDFAKELDFINFKLENICEDFQSFQNSFSKEYYR